MIKLQVIGNLGKDCVTNQVNGKSVINFNVAHTEKYKDSAGVAKEKTTWVECAYWTDRVAIAPYLKRGSQVFVEGIPELRHYQKNDGTPGSSLSLRVTSIQLLGSRPEGQPTTGAPANGNSYGSAPQQTPSAPSYPAGPQGIDDDLPF